MPIVVSNASMGVPPILNIILHSSMPMFTRLSTIIKITTNAIIVDTDEHKKSLSGYADDGASNSIFLIEA